MTSQTNIIIYLTSLVAVIGIMASSYFAIQAKNQTAEIEQFLQDRNALLQQNNQRGAELAEASTTISKLRAELHKVHEDLADIASNYKKEKNRNEEFEDQIQGLAGTLGDLDKLAKTDKELLMKYSKVYFLNENYIPSKLKQIPSEYVMAGKSDQYFHDSAIEHLENMLAAAKEDGIDLKVISAYRSFETQSDLKGQYTQIYGSGANTFSADQGYSEHQLGTTLDITTPGVGGTYTSFGETTAFKWLQDNAHRYGFILSYPKNNAFYIYEPWHWRFVGTDLARDLHKDGKSFYEMDQREIDSYLLNLFD